MLNKVRDSLLLSALTTISVGISSAVAFNEVTRGFLSPSISTIAVSFPLFLAVLKPGILLSDVMKAIVGCLIGWLVGALLFTVASAFPMQMGNRQVIATLLSFPFVFGLVLADPTCKSPLVSFIQPSVALVTMYVMSAFAKDVPYAVGLYILISYSVACFVTLSVFLSIRPVLEAGSTKTAIKESLSEFQADLTHWFEGLTASMLANIDQHSAELNERQEKASQSLAAFQSAMKLALEEDPLAILKDATSASSLSVTAVLLHSQLLALRGTIFREKYSQACLGAILNPVRDMFDNVRTTTTLALRPTSPGDIKLAATHRLGDEAVELYTEFAKGVALSASKFQGGLPEESSEEIRLVFAITSVVRFATLAQHLLLSQKGAATELLTPFRSFIQYYTVQFRAIFSKSGWRKTTNYKYAFRSALAQQVIAQLLIILSKSYPNRVNAYLFWAMLPVVTTFLNTVGAGLTIGIRNILGCLAGACVGVVTAAVTAGNEQAIFLQMLIITFTAKYLSNFSQWAVAILTFASTWNVLSIPNVHVEEVKVLITLVSYRISLTVIGVISSSILSIILFPSFAAVILRKSVARSVSSAARLVTEGITGVLRRPPLLKSTSFDEQQTVCSASFSPSVTVSVFEGAGSKALETIRKHSALIPAASDESRPELYLLEKLGDDPAATNSLASLIASQHLLKRLHDAASVFTSIAAATRVQENCHAVVFSKEFVHSLNQVVDMLDGAAARMASAIMDPKSNTVIESRLSGYVKNVTDELMKLRESLVKCGMLGAAERGGWLLVYVFHFALVEFTAAWDDLACHLDRKRRDSELSLIANSVEESFASPRRTSFSEKSISKVYEDFHRFKETGRKVSMGWI